MILGLYAIYSSIASPFSEGRDGLGELLEAGGDGKVSLLNGSEASGVMELLRGTGEWNMALEYLMSKGFDVDSLYVECYRVQHIDMIINLSRSILTEKENGSIAEFVIASDQAGMVSAWIIITNIPLKKVNGGKTPSNRIPVQTFSNGMPVFYVNFYHLVNGKWLSSNYWWHNSHDHPNWYYSQYEYWHTYYKWHDIPWISWYDWFFSWYYGNRFNYWSTWFPIQEPTTEVIGLVLFISLIFAQRRL